jgi:predicted PurR-regulated permease PerM
VALWVIATIATLFFLRAAATLLIPIVLGVLISYALEPVVAWMAGKRVPRLVGTSLVLLTLLGLAGWGVYSLRDDARDAIEALPDIARRAREILSSGASSGAGASLQEAAAELQRTDMPGSEPRQGTHPSGESAPPAGVESPVSLPSLLQLGVSSAFALAGHLTVIVFLVFFLLLSGHHVRNRLVDISGPDPERRRTTAKIFDDINAQIQRFLLVRLVTAAIVGLLTWGVLAWMDVPNAPIWGILAGVFNSIPYFGPIIVSGGLFLVGLVQDGGLVEAAQMAGAALVITSIEGWLLTPPLMGKAERMSALVVFLGLLLWTWVWGAWGTILAVPMLVVMKSVADHLDRLKPIGRLMAP